MTPRPRARAGENKGGDPWWLAVAERPQPRSPDPAQGSGGHERHSLGATGSAGMPEWPSLPLGDATCILKGWRGPTTLTAGASTARQGSTRDAATSCPSSLTPCTHT